LGGDYGLGGQGGASDGPAGAVVKATVVAAKAIVQPVPEAMRVPSLSLSLMPAKPYFDPLLSVLASINT